MSAPILEAIDLKRHFVARRPLFGEPTIIRAVDGVSLAIRRGETFAVVGESGCGKSTLARLLLRLIEPSEGTVLYQGEDMSLGTARSLRRLRSELQFIFQDPFSSLNPRMTVGAIIEEPLALHSELTKVQRRERVAELMRKMGLRPDHVGRYPHEFSGGQRQRIGIARALASGPKVLIGDEPVSALDVSIQAQIVNLLTDLKDELELTLVIIAHDLAIIRHISDRVAVMYLGEIVELAETDELYARPLHPYAQALMQAIPVADPTVARSMETIGGEMPSPAAPPPGCRFHPRCPHASEVCRTERPRLERADGERRVACHHWRTIESEGIVLAAASERTEAARQRFALYAARSADRHLADQHQKRSTS